MIRILNLRKLALYVLLACLLLAALPHSVKAEEKPAAEYDVVIYGGTSAAITAAVQTKQMGKSVIVVSPDKHLGGLTSGGLGWTDSGNKAAIGGLSYEFYHRVWKHYQNKDAWKFQTPEEYGNRSQGSAGPDREKRAMWVFAPHVAEKIFEDFVTEYDIPVVRDEWLDREQGVEKTDGRIRSITTLSGKKYTGKMFIDATYEGDLMAAAGVDYHTGREATSVYDEKWNGVQTGVLHHGHHFGGLKPISPYVIPDDPKSGLLPRVSAEDPGKYGEGDKRIQAYCFRMCLTNHPENRVPFPKPENYDAGQYELLLRVFNAGWRATFNKFDPLPNHKTDTNNHGPFSTDNIGYNYDYPEATYERRKEIIKEHEEYQQGLMWFIANDPRVPEDVQKRMQTWGLAKDEFLDNGHWPHQIYVREARRMIGKYVMTENELQKRRPTPEPVGMGSYTIDSHNVQRYITPEGYVQNEGDIGVPISPYQIAYGSLVPKAEQCENLLVPVCVSSSHIAFGSIRMEPVFMILGQSAATAAVMAIDDKISVQEVPYEKLREQLLKDEQVLELASSGGARKAVEVKSLEGVVLDDTAAKLTGKWTQSQSNPTYIGQGYQHESNGEFGDASATFTTTLPEPGEYEVRLGYTQNQNRAPKVKVTIEHADGVAEKVVNQQKRPEIDGLFISLGKYQFDTNKPAVVSVQNTDAKGFVTVDAVQWLPVKK